MSLAGAQQCQSRETLVSQSTDIILVIGWLCQGMLGKEGLYCPHFPLILNKPYHMSVLPPPTFLPYLPFIILSLNLLKILANSNAYLGPFLPTRCRLNLVTLHLAITSIIQQNISFFGEGGDVHSLHKKYFVFVSSSLRLVMDNYQTNYRLLMTKTD